MTPNPKFVAWLDASRRDVRHWAAAWGVTRAAVYHWRTGRRTPKLASVLAISLDSHGRVPPKSWGSR